MKNADYTIINAVHGLKNDVYGSKNDDFKLKNHVCGMKNHDFKLKNHVCGMKNHDCGMENHDFKLKNHVFIVPSFPHIREFPELRNGIYDANILNNDFMIWLNGVGQKIPAYTGMTVEKQQ